MKSCLVYKTACMFWIYKRTDSSELKAAARCNLKNKEWSFDTKKDDVNI